MKPTENDEDVADMLVKEEYELHEANSAALRSIYQSSASSQSVVQKGKINGVTKSSKIEIEQQILDLKVG